MNCYNCGAPIGDLMTTCSYCGASNKKEDTDGISIVKESDRPCPLCNIKLDTVSIPSDIPLYIERCRECKGLFFDPLELEDLLRVSTEEGKGHSSKSLKGLGTLLAEEGKGTVQNTKFIKCPVCRNLMTKKTYETHSGVTIDICKDGVWIDGGELNRIIRWVKVSGNKTFQPGADEKYKKDGKGHSEKKEGWKGILEAVWVVVAIIGGVKDILD